MLITDVEGNFTRVYKEQLVKLQNGDVYPIKGLNRSYAPYSKLLLINSRWHSPCKVFTEFLVTFDVLAQMGFEVRFFGNKKVDPTKPFELEFTKRINNTSNSLLTEYVFLMLLYKCKIVKSNIVLLSPIQLRVLRRDAPNINCDPFQWMKAYLLKDNTFSYLHLLRDIKEGAICTNSPVFGNGKESIRLKPLGYFQYIMRTM